MTASADAQPTDDAQLADPARVAAVRRVLEEGLSTAGLDRLTRLAADLLGAAHAQVSLLAEEQVVASVFGLPSDAPRTGALADSLCTVTVRVGVPFVVQDAANDPRVCDLAAGHLRRRRCLPRGAARDRHRPRARRAVRLRPGAAHLVGARRRGAGRARRQRGGRARAARPVARDDHQGGPARPGALRGRHRQLRLGPRHPRAAVGRPAGAAVRLRARRVRRAHRGLQRPAAPRRPRPGGRAPRARDRRRRRPVGGVPHRAAGRGALDRGPRPRACPAPTAGPPGCSGWRTTPPSCAGPGTGWRARSSR